MPLRPAFDGLVFDFDGTLLDSIKESYRTVCRIFERLGAVPPDFADYCDNFGPPYINFYHDRGAKASADQIWTWYRQETNHHSANLFSDVSAVLGQLDKAGLILGITSTQQLKIVREQCQRHNISGHFALIQGDLHEKAEAIVEFCKQYGLKRRRMAYIGDFGTDMREARRAGVIAIGITRGWPVRQVLIDAGAHHCLESLQELLPLVFGGQ